MARSVRKFRRSLARRARNRSPRGAGHVHPDPWRRIQLEPLEPRILLSGDVGLTPEDLAPAIAPAVEALLPEQLPVLPDELPAVEAQLDPAAEAALAARAETLEPDEAAEALAAEESEVDVPDDAVEAGEPAAAPAQAGPSEAASGADDGEELVEAWRDAQLESLRIEHFEARAEPPREIVVIDGSVPDAASLLDALRDRLEPEAETQTAEPVAADPESQADPGEGADDGDDGLRRLEVDADVTAAATDAPEESGSDDWQRARGIQVVVLDPGRDGIDQIGEILSHYDSVAAVHVLSHGRQGSLRLGTSQVDAAELARRGDDVADFARALAPGGDLLLYGCDVAGGQVGVEFVRQLAVATGADVAASTDDTGAASLGGDWDLEHATGAVADTPVQRALAGSSFASLLAPIANTGTASDPVFNLAVLDTALVSIDSVRIRDGAAGQLVIDSLNGTFDDITLAKAGLASVTLLMGEGGDSLSIDGVDFDGKIIVGGGLGGDTFTLSNDVRVGSIDLDTGLGDDTITVTGDVVRPGGEVKLVGDTVRVATGATIDVSDATKAGSVFLLADVLEIGTDGGGTAAALRAEGATPDDGDGLIRLHASRGGIFSPVANVDPLSVKLDIQNAAIEGETVELLAQIDASATAEFGGEADPTEETILPVSFLQTLLGIVEPLSVGAGASVQVLDADLLIGEDAVIRAGSLAATASLTSSARTAPIKGAVAVAVAITDAQLDVAGTIVTEGDAKLEAIVDNTVSAKAAGLQVKGFSAEVAVGVLDSNSVVHVKDGADLQVGTGGAGKLEVLATTTDNVSITATSGSGKDGVVAIAAAVGVENGTTQAFFDGTADVEGDLIVKALHEKGTGAVSASAGVGINTSGDLVADTVKVAKGKVIGKVTDFLKKKKDEQNEEGKKTKANIQAFDLAAGVAVHIDNNTAEARIDDGTGTGADVQAAGLVDVKAFVTNRPTISAGSTASQSEDIPGGSQAKFGGSFAVDVGVYGNTANATVGGGAQIDAGTDLQVEARTINDYTASFGVDLIDPFLRTADFNTGGGNQIVQKGQIVEVLSGHTAGGDAGVWYEFTDDDPVEIDLANEDFTSARWANKGAPATTRATDFVTAFMTYLNNTAGVSKAADSWAQATAEGQALAVAGAVSVVEQRQTAEAVIQSGARINQRLDTGNQNVVVQSLNKNETVYLGGNINLLGPFGDKKEFQLNFQKPGVGVGGDGTKGAVGATAIVAIVDDTTTARIEDGVVLQADSLEVDAQHDVLSVGVGASGGEAAKVALNGAFLINVIDADTTAQIENGADIVVGSGEVKDAFETSSVFVEATDRTFALQVAGGVAVSESIGFGASVAVNVVDRSAQAVIGELLGSPIEGAGSFQAGGDVLVRATEGGFIGGLAVAGAKASSDPTPEPPDSGGDPAPTDSATGTMTKDGQDTDDPLDGVSLPALFEEVGQAGGGQGKTGIAIAGSVVVNTSKSDARAYVRETGAFVAGGDLVLLASDATTVGALAGAVAFASGSSGGSDVAIAGAVGFNMIGGTAEAFVDGAASLVTESLDLDASRAGDLISISAGFAGAPNKSGIAIAGSVSINLIDNFTLTGLRNVAGASTVDGLLTLDAKDDSDMVVVAGSVAFGGRAGIGAAVSVNDIDNTVRSEIRAVDELAFTGDLRLDAATDSDIISVTGSLGAGTQGLGAAGTVSVNQIDNVVEAIVAGSALRNTTATGDVGIRARDDSAIFAFSGGFGFGKTVGIGAAVSYSDIDNRIAASIDDSVVRAPGSLDVTATSANRIIAVTLGAGGGKVGIAGSVSINEIGNTVSALISGGSDVEVGGDVIVQAADSSTMVVVAGGIAIGGQVGVGASAGTTELENTIVAGIDGSVVTSTGGAISVLAGFDPVGPTTHASSLGIDGPGLIDDSSAQIVNVTVAGSGGGTFALGAAVSLNWLRNQVDARITGGSTVTAEGNVRVAARDEVEIDSAAASAAGAGSVAIGAAISLNYIGGNPNDPSSSLLASTRARIEGSTVTSNAGDVQVATNFDPRIVNFTVGGAAGGDVAVGGSVSVNFIRGDVFARIADGANVTANGSISVESVTTPVMLIVAGNGAGAGSVAAAAAAATNDVRVDVDAVVVGSTLLATTGDVSVRGAVESTSVFPTIQKDHSEDVNAQIWTLSVSGGGAGSVALAGSLSLNWVRNDVDAHISGGSVTANAGTVRVEAEDNAGIHAVAGAGIGSGSVAVGASVAFNYLGGDPANPGSSNRNTIEAFIDGGAVVRAAAVEIRANSTSNIKTLTFSGQGSGTFAAGGAVSLNFLRKDVDASLGVVDLVTAGDVDVEAMEQARFDSGAGQVSVGASGGGVGASFAFNDISNQIRARAEGSTITTQGSLNLDADSASTVASGAAGIAGGFYAGVAGSAAVTLVDNTVESLISGATVTSDANVVLLANSHDDLSVGAGSLGVGAVGAGGTAIVNDIDTTTRARVVSSDVTARGQGPAATVSRWTRDGSGVLTEGTEEIRGLAAVASGAAEVFVVGATAGAGGLGIAANVIVNLVSDTTEASIEDSRINQGGGDRGDVVVRAHHDTLMNSGSGAAGVGANAIGAAIDIDVIDNVTRAFVLDSGAAGAAEVAGRRVDVGASSREDLESTTIGAAIGLAPSGLALAGSISVMDTSSRTEAFLEKASVESEGDLLVTATGDLDIAIRAGALSASLGAGVGGGVVVALADHQTRAFTSESTTNARGATRVAADSSTDVMNVAATLGAGGIAGVAGAVIVVDIANETRASLEQATVNQDAAFDAATQDVVVSAQENLKVDDTAGAGGFGGLAGVGAGVDVMKLRTTVDAQIGAGSQVAAGRDVRVAADSQKELDSFVLSFAGGIVGINGAVSVLSVGSGLDAEGAGEADNMQGAVNGMISPDQQTAGALPDELPSFGSVDHTGTTRTYQTNAMQAARAAADRQIDIDGALSTGTAAGDTNARIGAGATVTAGRDIDVQADDGIDVDATVGQGTGGLVSVGGSVSVATLDQGTLASADGTLRAGGDIRIGADAINTSDQLVAAGTVGLVGLGAQVAILDDTSAQRASLVGGSTVTSADEIEVRASADRTATADAIGVQVGLVSAGAAVAQADAAGSTTATVGDGVQIGQGGDVGDVDVTATSTADLKADTKAVSAGIASGAGADADARFTPDVTARIGADARITALRSVDVLATAQGATRATALGVNAGGLTVGASLADALSDATVSASIGDRAVIRAEDVSARAQQLAPDTGRSAFSNATAASGSLIGVNATKSMAQANGDATATIGSGASILAGSTVAVSATNHSSLFAGVSGKQGALLALGFNFADANTDKTTAASIGAGVEVLAGTLRVEAGGSTQSTSDAMSGSGGIISGTASEANTDSRSETSATIGASTVDVGLLVLGASYLTRYDGTADSINASVVGASGARTTHKVDPTVRAQVAASADLRAREMEIDATNRSRKDLISGVNINSGSGGLIDLPAVNSQSTLDHETLVEIGDAARIDVVADSDRIVFAEAHGLAEGDAVTYRRVGGADPGDLEAGKTYFVHVVDDRTVQLADDLIDLALRRFVDVEPDALAGLAEVGDGRVEFVPADTVLGPEIGLAFEHGLETGEAVVYTASGAPIGPITRLNPDATTFQEGGLTDGDTYFVRVVDPQRLTLHATRDDALAGVDAIQMEGQLAGAGGHQLVRGAAAPTQVGVVVDSAGDAPGDAIPGQSAPGSAGRLDVQVLNEVSGDDRVKLESGGAIPIAKAESMIDAGTTGDPMVGRVTIGPNADIDTDSDTVVGIRTSGNLSTFAQAKTWGLAAAAETDAESSVVMDQDIQVRSGVDVRSGGEIQLVIGREGSDPLDTPARLTLLSESTFANRSGIPISKDPGATARSDQTNRITVDQGASLRSVRDTDLIVSDGEVTLEGIGDGKDYALGFIPISRSGGDEIRESDDGVIINGAVRVGIQNEQVLILDIDRTAIGGDPRDLISVTRQDEGIEFRERSTTFAADLEERLDQLITLRDAYSGDPVAKDAFNAEIRFLQQQVIDLGFGFIVPDGTGGGTELVDPDFDLSTLTQEQVDDIALDADVPIRLITVSPIFAQSADIVIEADFLQGGPQAVLDAPGDTVIRVINATPAFLRIEGAVIPDEAGGRILFKGAPILGDTLAERRQAISDRNDRVVPVQFAEINTKQTSDPPLIEIVSSFNPDEPQNEIDFPGVIVPVLEVTGDIENVLGTVRIRNEAGSISVAADISADTIDLFAGKDLVLSFIEGFRHLGGEPRSHWRDLVDANEAVNALIRDLRFKLEQDTGGVVSIDLSTGGLAPVVAQTMITLAASVDLEVADAQAKLNRIIGADLTSPRGGFDSTSVAGNNVFIAGRFLNINGVVQSGVPNWSLQIDDSPQLEALIRQFNAENLRTGQRFFSLVGEDGRPLVPSISTRSSGGVVRDEIVEVFWDTDEQRFQLIDQVVGGGFMEILGHIMNTGGEAGELRVMDGFGRFVIDNNTSHDILVKDLDTARARDAQGIEGRIQITDSAKVGQASAASGNTALTTIYTRVGDTIRVVDSATRDAQTDDPNRLVRETTGRLDSYTPRQDQHYVFKSGQDQIDKQVLIFEDRSWGGIDFLVPDREAKSNTTTKLQETPLPEGEFQRDDASNSTYDFSFDNRQLFNSSTYDVKTRKGGFLGLTKTVTTTITRTTGSKNINTHSLRADFPIAVRFIGDDSGSISVESGGDVILGGRLHTEVGDLFVQSDGAIRQEVDKASLVADDVVLRAGTGVGDASAEVMTDVINSTLDVVTTTGDIFVDEVIEGVEIVQARTGDGNVNIRAQGSIVALTADTLVQGERIELRSESGKIEGFEGANLRIDLGDGPDAALTAVAQGDVRIQEIAGDMPLLSVVSASGDVVLDAAAGDVTDANPAEDFDPRELDELRAIWTEMRLFGAEAEASKAQGVSAFKNLKTRQYQEFWASKNVEIVDPTDIGFDVATAPQGADRLAFGSAHGFVEGEVVTYDRVSGADPGSLVDGTDYVVHVVDANTIQLAANEADRAAGVFLDVDATGLGAGEEGELTNQPTGGDPAVVKRFAAASAADGADRLAFATPHGLTDGQAVGYARGLGAGDLAGLDRGETYFVRVVDATTIQLAATEADLAAGTFVDLDRAGLDAGTGALTPVGADFARFAASDVVAGELAFEFEHGFETGDAVRYQQAADGPIGGLTGGENVYVRVVDATTIALHASRADAIAGTDAIPLDATGAGQGAHELAGYRADATTFELGAEERDVLGKQLRVQDPSLTDPQVEAALDAIEAEREAEFGAFFDPNFQFEFAPGSTTQADLEEGAVWTLDELESAATPGVGAIVFGLSDTVPDQEDPNVSGRDVRITASGRVGKSLEQPVTVSLFDASGEIRDFEDLSQEEQIALATAEPGDIELSTEKRVLLGPDGLPVQNPDGSDRLVSERITITLKEDVDVDASGVIRVVGGEDVFIGSELDAVLDQVIGADEVRIKAEGSIVDSGREAVQVIGTDAILESGQESIGAADRFIRINLADRGDLTARARDAVFVEEVSGSIDLVFARADDLVRLVVDGSVFDGLGNDELNVGGGATATAVFQLTAGGSVGTADDFLDVILLTGPIGGLQVDAGDDVFVRSPGALDVDDVRSAAGDVHLRTQGLLAGTDVLLHSVTALQGTVTVQSDLAILDADRDGDAEIVALGARLLAGSNVGLGSARIGTQVDRLEGATTVGAFFLTNEGDLEIGGLPPLAPIGAVVGVSSEEETEIEARGSIRVSEDVASRAGNILLVGRDDVTFATGAARSPNLVTIEATTGAILDDDPAAPADDVAAGQAILRSAAGVGTDADPLETTVGNLEAEGGTGGVFVDDKGGLVIGGVSPLVGVRADETIRITSASPLTVTEDVVSANADITLHAVEDAAAGDDLVVTNGATVDAATTATLLAGDDLRADAGTTVRSGVSITLRGDHADADAGVGTRIDLDGSLDSTTIRITGERDDDVFDLALESLAGHTTVLGDRDGLAGGEDRFIVDRLPTLNTSHVRPGHPVATPVRDTLDLDGRGGTDRYEIQVAGGRSDSIINVDDTGAPDDGTDTLTITGTDAGDPGNASGNDLFLLRERFVAYLTPQTPLGDAGAPPGELHPEVERINYDRGVNGRLLVTTGEGDDQFYVDDNSAPTTLDGGQGRDFFQVGQVFGEDPNDAAADDVQQIDLTSDRDAFEVTPITRGFLTVGVDHPTVLQGGEGADTFSIYSNKAELRMEGEDGNDVFSIRAFVAEANLNLNAGAGDDLIEYNINAPVSINGGDGFDTVVALGTEADDVFLVTEDGVFGAGLNIRVDGVEEALEVDGLEGDDTFFVLSTRKDVVTTLIGGLGSDTVNVGGDQTEGVVSRDLRGRLGSINHGTTSGDADYDRLVADGVQTIIADPDQATFQIVESDGETRVIEGTAVADSYTIAMQLDPATVDAGTVAFLTVSAALSSSHDRRLDKRAGGTVDAQSILVSTNGTDFFESLVVTFDASQPDWNTPREIFVRAASDDAIEGERTVVVNHSLLSTNGALDETPIPNVAVKVLDDDEGALIFRETDDATRVLEGQVGAIEDTYAVRLSVAPTADVVVALAPEDGEIALFDEGGNPLTELVFTAANFDQERIVTVRAVDDATPENRLRTAIGHTLTSGDPIFQDVGPFELEVVVFDDDRPGVLVTESGGTTIVGPGQSDDYTLRLVSEPDQDVVLDVFSDGQTLVSSGGAGASATQVTFTPTDWFLPQTITVDVDPSFTPQPGDSFVRQEPVREHLTSRLEGPLIVEGGVAENKDRSLRDPVALPTELAAGAKPLEVDTDETRQSDRLFVFNDSSRADDTGSLTATTLANSVVTLSNPRNLFIDGMGGPLQVDVSEAQDGSEIVGFEGGITFDDIEVTEVLLGEGNDTFTVDATSAGTPGAEDLVVTAIHGGGNRALASGVMGGDTLLVTGGGGPLSPLVLYGDTSQDGSRTDSLPLPGQNTGNAFVFANPGNDRIDASASAGGVTIYGGEGDDVLIGSQGGDQIAGGSGDDEIRGQGGDDHVYGDAGFNVDLATRELAVPIVNTSALPNADPLVPGRDRIFGEAGNDILLGDFGVIEQEAGTERLSNTGSVVETRVDATTGGEPDVIEGGTGDDQIAGSRGDDTLTGNEGTDLILGDGGTLALDGDARLVSETTLDDGADQITGDDGDDLLAGGGGADTIEGNGGNDFALGDAGTAERDALGNTRIESVTTDLDGDDLLSGNEGEDLLAGGGGADTISGDAGDDLALGDAGTGGRDAGGTARIESETTALDGDDAIRGDDGDDLLAGGGGADEITGGEGRDLLLGDGGRGAQNGVREIVSETSVLDGDDLLVGEAGNDVLAGGGGADQINGGSGNDIALGDAGSVGLDGGGSGTLVSLLTGLDGGDTILGEDGDDVLAGGGATDVIRTGNGRNFAMGADGTVTLVGFVPTRFVGGLGDGAGDFIFGGLGRDFLFGSRGPDFVDAGDGDDVLSGDTGDLRFSGAWVPTSLEVGRGPGSRDTLLAGRGNDVAVGGAGGDRIEGGAGSDGIIGDLGNALFSGGVLVRLEDVPGPGGNDLLLGGPGNDRIFGGGGSDAIQGGSGNDALLGDHGVITQDRGRRLTFVRSGDPRSGSGESLRGGTGDDILIGGAGSDDLRGESGNDVAIGDGGLVTFTAGRVRTAETADLFIGAADRVDGGPGNDLLFGGAGNDVLVGSLSEDALVGDFGRLTFEDPGADFVVSLGQNPLDLITLTMFDLFSFTTGIPDLSRSELISLLPIGEGVPAPLAGLDAPFIRAISGSGAAEVGILPAQLEDHPVVRLAIDDKGRVPEAPTPANLPGLTIDLRTGSLPAVAAPPPDRDTPADGSEGSGAGRMGPVFLALTRWQAARRREASKTLYFDDSEADFMPVGALAPTASRETIHWQ